MWEINDRFVNRQQKNGGAIADCTIYPSKHVKLYFETMHPKMIKMLKDFNFYNGTMFIQAFVDVEVILPYDHWIRFSGVLSYFITKHVFDVNPLELMINTSLVGRMCLGDENLIERISVDMNGRFLANYSILAKRGTIAEIEGLDRVAKMPEVFRMLQLLHVGDEVKMIGTLQQVFARFHIETKSREELNRVMNEVYNTIQLKGIDGENMKLCQKISIL